MADPVFGTSPLADCDIVMKGGITSGLVYPPAILELARRYRFRSIGGASAGGIVAAMTAAAEYARQRGDADAFVRMQTAAGELHTPGRLKNLFQPCSALRAPLQVFLSLLKGKTTAARFLWGLVSLALNTPVAFMLGLLVGGLLWLGTCDAIGFLLHQMGWVVPSWLVLVTKIVSFALLVLVGAAFGGGLGVALSLLTRLPKNDYGICPGHASGTQDAAAAKLGEPLTDWLHEKINTLAQRGASEAPLTIKDLDTVGINVRMMTSNISQAQPYVLPFRDRIFLFKDEEMRALFPAPVVNHLITNAYKSPRLIPPAGFHFMPEPPDFPLIVAARLSLSFPLLISAVPLYTVRHSAYARTASATEHRLAADELQRNLFSDGGISSNFPIHFFDAWYPGRPTFGINLTNWPQDAFVDTHCQRLNADNLAATPAQVHSSDADTSEVSGNTSDAVFLPAANTDTPPEVQSIGTVGGFLMAVFSTAQNYRDNAQAHLPSYRERIVQVRLKDDEGGLNLDMDPAMIDQMLKKGQMAGEVLRDKFQMDQHQWVRLLVLMQQLERQLQDLRTALTPKEYQRVVQAMLHANPENPFPYSRDEAWAELAGEAMPCLFELLENWQDVKCFAPHHPHPASVLRVTPDYDVYPDSGEALTP